MVSSKKYVLIIRWDNGEKKGTDVRRFNSLEDALTIFNNFENSAIGYAEQLTPTAMWNLTEKKNLVFGNTPKHYSFSLECGKISFSADLDEVDFLDVVDMSK